MTARERRLAGLPIDDPEGRDYATLRASYLADWKTRNEALLESGFGTREQLDMEWESLHEDFPEP